MQFRNIAVFFTLLMLNCLATQAQTTGCPVMPDGFVCISQAAANQAAANTRELAASKEKIGVLEQSLIDKDKNTDEIKAAAAKNEADLKGKLSDTQTHFAETAGELIATKAELVRANARIDFLLTNGRKKCSWSVICFP